MEKLKGAIETTGPFLGNTSSLPNTTGNKNCSSWSQRPWLLLRHFGISFTEHMVSVAGRDYNPLLKPLAGQLSCKPRSPARELRLASDAFGG